MAGDVASGDRAVPRCWPVDRLTAGFFIAVGVATAIFFRRIPLASKFLWADVAILGALYAIWLFTPRLSPRAAAIWRLIHGCAATPLVFTQVGFLVRDLRGAEYAAILERLDRALFLGVNPLEWVEGIARPWLTEVMQWAYTIYILMPAALIVLLALRGTPWQVSRSCFCLLGAMYVSYVGYFLVPASGPNLHNNLGPVCPVDGVYPYPLLTDLYRFTTDLPGTWATRQLREWMFLAEATKQDCFPSGHVAVAAVCWVLARRLRPAYGRWFLLPALGVAVSTVYLRYHFVIDVVFGLLLAWFAVTALGRLHDRWARCGASGVAAR
jgi:membrane-associated phospholipid phosphatase